MDGGSFALPAGSGQELLSADFRPISPIQLQDTQVHTQLILFNQSYVKKEITSRLFLFLCEVADFLLKICLMLCVIS